MLIRDIDGRLVIIARKDCKNENVYNEKIFNIRLPFTQKYKSVFVNPKIPKYNSKELHLNDFSDD